MPTDVQKESVGRHVIHSGKMAGRWSARAFIGNDTAGGTETGDSREEAVAKVRAALTREAERERSEAGTDGIPSAAAYAAAFRRLRRLPDGYEAMLRAHYEAPGHAITATQLAEAAGYENWNAANLHYGKLGERVAAEIGYEPRRRANGTPIWTAALAIDGDAAENNPHFHWKMRPEVVTALRDRWPA